MEVIYVPSSTQYCKQKDVPIEAEDIAFDVSACRAMIFANPATAALTIGTIYQQPATAPSGALWLNDAFGGHLWVSDHISGFCRPDPDPLVPGTATLNQDSCYNFGLAVQRDNLPSTRPPTSSICPISRLSRAA